MYLQYIICFLCSRNLWLKACSCTVQPSQSELKFEFPLPIVARNVILEFVDFYENPQVCIYVWIISILQCTSVYLTVYLSIFSVPIHDISIPLNSVGL